MTITKGNAIKNIILYHPTKPSPPIGNDQPYPHEYQEEKLHSALTLDEALEFKS